MSLYNMMHGIEQTAGIVVGLLKVDPSAIPRFRDAYLTYKDENNRQPVMVILTRTGGGNRRDYEDGNAMLRTLPGFIDDIDDEFDHTFALFRYEAPDELHEGLLNLLSEYGPPLTLRQKTEQAIGPDQTRPQREAMQRIADQLGPIVKGAAG